MDKKKNFESYAKSLFGKAFGKKKPKNHLSNDEDEDSDGPAPFKLSGGSNTPLFTISSRKPSQFTPRDTTSTSQLDLMFDSTELNDLEDLEQPSPDFKLTQPKDVLVDVNRLDYDAKKKSKKAKRDSSIDLDINANVHGETYNKKHKTSDKEIVNSKHTNDKVPSKKSNEIDNTIETIEVIEKKRPRKDKRSKSKLSSDISSNHDNKSQTKGLTNDNKELHSDLSKTKNPVSTQKKSKELRTSKLRLEKQNSERDDSGISLNEGDDIFWYLGDDEPTFDTYSRRNSRSDSDCELSYFCVDHMKMCTSRAELRKHRNCQLDRKSNSSNSAVNSSGTPGRKTPLSNPRTIRVLSSDKKSSELSEASRSSHVAHLGMAPMQHEILEQLYNYAGVMVEDREKSKAELQRRKEDMEEWILDYVQEIIKIIMKAKERVVPHFDEFHNQTLDETTQIVSKLHLIRHESRLVWQSLQVPNDFSDFEKYRSIINDASHKTHEIAGQLREKYDSSENLKYEFQLSPEVQHLQETETIAKIGLITGIPSLPPFLTMPGEHDAKADQSNFTSLKSLDSSVNIDGNQVAKNSKYCFTGCSYILSDAFILADWAGGMIKMISKYGLVADNLKFEQSPWDVVQTCTGQVAVTVPRMRTVYFVEAEPHLKVSKSFSTGCQCFGICKTGDNFAMTCDPWSRSPSIRVFDSIGNTLIIVEKDSIGENLFKCPLHICSDFFNSVFYVSDSTADCVYGLSLTGEIIFSYEHNELDYPGGIATDRNNYLYICGRKSANIHKISNTGELRERFLQRRHGVCSPCALAFNPDGDHLILSDLSGPVSTGFWKVQLS